MLITFSKFKKAASSYCARERVRVGRMGVTRSGSSVIASRQSGCTCLSPRMLLGISTNVFSDRIVMLHILSLFNWGLCHCEYIRIVMLLIIFLATDF